MTTQKLTPLETKVFNRLKKNEGEPVSREELYQAMYSNENINGRVSRNLDVYIGYLRKKGFEIVPVIKYGYKLITA